MIQQARQVTTSGLCRGELEGVVAGAGRVIAAMSALQTRCATEIEALDDGGVNSKVVLREAGRMSTRAANTVAKTAAGLAEMPSWLSRWLEVLLLSNTPQSRLGLRPKLPRSKSTMNCPSSLRRRLLMCLRNSHGAGSTATNPTTVLMHTKCGAKTGR